MTRAWGDVFSIVVILAGACTGGGQTSTQAQHSSGLPVGALTPDSAVLRVAVEPVQRANVLTLRLSSIENPMAEDFALDRVRPTCRGNQWWYGAGDWRS
jgi:hypothetical protein